MTAYRNNSWILFLSITSLLVGIFCLARISLNLLIFPTYPVSGVLPIFQPTYIPVSTPVSSCNMSQVYYDQQGMPTTTPSEAEKKQSEQSKEQCIQNIVETRNATLLNDLGTTGFFLFLGLVLLGIRRFIK